MVALPSAFSSAPESSLEFIGNLFRSPEYYPMQVDFQRGLITFVNMSRETYRNSVFLDTRTHHLGSKRVVRLDDVLLAEARISDAPKPVVYILHPAFCCSTLLARYFEIFPFMFVLKEPLLLTQIALTPRSALSYWQDLLELTVKLLTRTYRSDQRVMIKAHEPCNSIGVALLEGNEKARVIFIRTPLSHFVVSVLKVPERRSWIRRRVHEALGVAGLAEQPASGLSDAQAAACLWSLNCSLCEELSSGPLGSRVFVLDSDRLIDSPEQTLLELVQFCQLPSDAAQIAAVASHPSMRKYSKDVSRKYDARSRRCELAKLEARFRDELQAAAEWSARAKR
jgi:hypothetical protein